MTRRSDGVKTWTLAVVPPGIVGDNVDGALVLVQVGFGAQPVLTSRTSLVGHHRRREGDLHLEGPQL